MPVGCVPLQVKLKDLASRILIRNIKEITECMFRISHHPDVIPFIQDMLFQFRQELVGKIVMVIFLPRKGILCRQRGGRHHIDPCIHTLFLEILP